MQGRALTAICEKLYNLHAKCTNCVGANQANYRGYLKFPKATENPTGKLADGHCARRCLCRCQYRSRCRGLSHLTRCDRPRATRRRLRASGSSGNIDIVGEGRQHRRLPASSVRYYLIKIQSAYISHFINVR